MPFVLDRFFDGDWIPWERTAWPTLECALRRLDVQVPGAYRIREGTCGELRRRLGGRVVRVIEKPAGGV